MTTSWKIVSVAWLTGNTFAGHSIQRIHNLGQSNMWIEQFVADGKNLFSKEQAKQLIVDLL